MSLLLDTHVVLWWLADDPTLADDIKDRLDHEPDVYVSAATIWEVAIKQAIGKLPEPTRLPERIQESGFRPLPISADHAIIAARLPMIHRDRFDRMLVAQAKLEELTLVTRDENCRQYEVDIPTALRPTSAHRSANSLRGYTRASSPASESRPRGPRLRAAVCQRLRSKPGLRDASARAASQARSPSL
jgi:PIN domain nuclease of toxin-antitoxin system